MAASLGSLIVRLGLDATDYTTALTKAEASAQRFAQTTDRAIKSSARGIDSVVSSVNLLKNAFAGIAGALGIKELARLSDSYQSISARLSIVTDSSDDLIRVQSKLLNIANSTRQSLTATSDLYFKTATATRDLGTSQKDLLRLTEGINKALIVSGASGQSAESALVQLGQALGSNRFAGQEFTSVNEQANRITRALAEGLHVTVGELKTMSNTLEGIDTATMVRGLLAGFKTIDDEFKKIPLTISGALVVAENELQKFLGVTLKASGGTSAIAQTILTLANNIDLLAAAGAGFVATKLSAVFLKIGGNALRSVEGVVNETIAEVNLRKEFIATNEALAARMNFNQSVIRTAAAQASAEKAVADAIITKNVAVKADSALAAAKINELAQLGAAQTSVSAKITAAQASLSASLSQQEVAQAGARAAIIAKTEAEIASLVATQAVINKNRELALSNLNAAQKISPQNNVSKAIIAAQIADLASLSRTQAVVNADMIAAEGRLAIAKAESAGASNIKRAAVVAETEAEIARLVATQATIVAAREQVVAELAAANAVTVHTIAVKADAAASAASALTLAELAVANAITVNKLVEAENAAALAASKLAAASGLATRAINLLGGPIGLVTLALGIGVTAWQFWASSAQKAADDAVAATERSTEDILTSLEKQAKALEERNRLANEPQKQKAQLSEGAEEAARLRKEAIALRAASKSTPVPVEFSTGATADIPGFEQADIVDAKAAKIEAALKRVEVGTEAANKRARQAAALKWGDFYASQADKADAAVARIKKELGGFVKDGGEFTADLEKLIRAHFVHTSNPKDDPSKKFVQGQVKDLEAAIAREHDILVASESFLRDSYDQGLLSVENYYDKVQDARQHNINNVVKDINEQITAQEILRDFLAKGTDKQDADNKVNELKAKLLNFLRDQGFQENQLNRDRLKNSQEYGDLLSELNAKMLDLAGNTAAAAAIRFDISNRVTGNLLKSSGDEKALKQLATSKEQEQVEKRLNDLTKQYTISQGYLSIAQERINIARESGAISEIEALEKTSALNVKIVEILKTKLAVLEAEAKLSKDPAALLAVENMKVALEKVAAATDLVADKFNGLFGSSFSDALQALANGTKSFKDAVRDFGKDIVGKINKVAGDVIADSLFGKGGPASGIGGIFAKLFGKGEAVGSVPGITDSKDVTTFTGGGTVSDLFAKLFSANPAKAATDAAASASLTSAGTILTTSGTLLTESGTLLTTAGTGFSAVAIAMDTAAIALNSAGILLSTAATALITSAGASGIGGLAGALGGAGGGASSIPGSFTGPQFGTVGLGTNSYPGGWAKVGEFGEEMVHLPKGTEVYSADEAKGMMGKTVQIHQTINVLPGASTESVRQATNRLRDATMKSIREI